MATVLIVDDAPDIRFLMSNVLTHAGYRVEEAGGGIEALRRLAEPDPPQIMILDIQMPDMDGWQTLMKLRGAASTATLPVILCTVRAGVADAIRAWQIGCDGYVTKPFSTADLVSEVQAVHSRSDTERVLMRKQRLFRAQTGGLAP